MANDKTPGEKQSETKKVKEFLKKTTGSPEGREGAKEVFDQVLKKAIKPKK